MLARRLFTPLVPALLFGAVFTPACSEDEVEGPGPIPLESALAELGGARCEFLVRCGWDVDQATCLDYHLDTGLLQLVADVGWGRVGYDAAAARACVEAQRAQSCDVLQADVKALEATCKAAFGARVPASGECFLSSECVGDLYCDFSTCNGETCCSGVCTAPPARAPIGADCSAALCQEGAYCEQTETGQACAPQVDNGAPCGSQEACKDGARCDQGSSGDCYILSREGETCNPMLAAGGCLSLTNWCDPAQMKCVRLPGAGQPCAGANGSCLPYAVCNGSVCMARPRDGEMCVDGGPACLSDLQCSDTGSCPPRRNFAACY
jgi:hypothetical protein